MKKVPGRRNVSCPRGPEENIVKMPEGAKGGAFSSQKKEDLLSINLRANAWVIKDYAENKMKTPQRTRLTRELGRMPKRGLEPLLPYTRN
jgi:hypothetical protein